MPGSYSHIIWDWNGTLLCDVGAALGAVNRMLLRRMLPEISLEQYRERIAIPIRGFYEKTFYLEQEDYDALLQEYNRDYELLLEQTLLTPGVLRVLQYARECGLRQAIVSSSENSLLLRSLARFGIAEYFDAVLGAEDFLAGSKIERAQRFLAEHRVQEGRVLAVGDLAHDAEMAQAIGADCALLTSGHQGRAQLCGLGAAVLEQAEDLIGLLQGYTYYI